MTSAMAAYRLAFAGLWGLVILWLLGGQGVDARSEPVPGVTAATPPWRSSVQGYGRTQTEAQHDAVRKAIEETASYVQHLQPPIVFWEPTEAYVREHLLADTGQAGPDVDIEQLGRVKTWMLTLKTPDLAHLAKEERKAFLAHQKREREATSQERLLLAGKVLLGGMLILLVIYGRGRFNSYCRRR